MTRLQRGSGSVLAALASAVTLALIGLLGMWSGLPWLFPSLGPTIAIQTLTPDAPGARPWNILLGHLAGMAGGFSAVYLTGANDTLSVVSAHALSLPRVAAAALAVLISLLLQGLLKAEHPPAEATTLLIALGALPATPRNAAIIVCGVALVTLLGQIAIRLLRRLRQA